MKSAGKATEDDSIELPPPQADHPATLVAALRARHSGREYASRPLPIEALSTLLWCAFGINRPGSGGRTAPSAHNWQEVDVYVTLPTGAYRYEARGHALRLVAAVDLRPLSGVQEFVATAPVNLVYVADLAKMVDAGAEDRLVYSSVGAGCVAQNVYLCCAATGLECVARGLIDRPRLAQALRLRPEQRILLAQTVGYRR